MKIKFYNLMDTEKEAILNEKQVEELFNEFSPGTNLEVSAGADSSMVRFDVSSLSTDQHRLISLSKYRKLKNSAFQRVEYNDEEVDDVSLREFTMFTLNKDGCCAVLEFGSAPAFMSNMRKLLKHTLKKNNYNVAIVLSPTDLACSQLTFVDKITLSSDRNSTLSTNPDLINRMSSATKIKKGSIKSANLTMILENNTPFEKISHMFKNVTGYKNATIHGTDTDGDVLIDVVSSSITRFIEIDIDEKIDKKKLQTIFDGLVRSYYSL